jgi:hypothetical protein
VSRRRVLEAVFILLEFRSPSRRIFIGSHSLPPSLVRRIGPSVFPRHPWPKAPWILPRATCLPLSASYHGWERAARFAGPSRASPRTRAGRGPRRTTAASSPSPSYHRQAAPLFEGRTPPLARAMPEPPAMAAAWTSSCSRALSSLADTPSTLPTSHSSHSARLLARPSVPSRRSRGHRGGRRLASSCAAAGCFSAPTSSANEA